MLTIAAAVVAFFQGVSPTSATPLYAAAGLAVLHSLATTQAAPTNFSQRQVAKDEAALACVFDRFELADAASRAEGARLRRDVVGVGCLCLGFLEALTGR